MLFISQRGRWSQPKLKVGSWKLFCFVLNRRLSTDHFQLSTCSVEIIFSSSSSGLTGGSRIGSGRLIKGSFQPLERLLDGPVKPDHDDIVFTLITFSCKIFTLHYLFNKALSTVKFEQ
jgi:hypothetical protein